MKRKRRQSKPPFHPPLEQMRSATGAGPFLELLKLLGKGLYYLFGIFRLLGTLVLACFGRFRRGFSHYGKGKNLIWSNLIGMVIFGICCFFFYHYLTRNSDDAVSSYSAPMAEERHGSSEDTSRNKELPPNILTTIDTSKVKVVALPRPNSGTYSYEEAEKRKKEIYDMQLSVKQFNWKNPTSGGAVHINKNDEIEVYQFTMGLMYLGKDVDVNGDTVIVVDTAPKDTSFVVQKEDLSYHVGGVGLGNPASVLITSEYDVAKSKSLPLILDEVYTPGMQIYFLKKK